MLMFLFLVRPSSHPLSEALKAGIEALGGSYIDYGKHRVISKCCISCYFHALE